MSPGDWADRQLRNPEACSISQHENGTRPAEGEKGYGNQKLKNRPENGELLRPAISGKAEDERLQTWKLAMELPEVYRKAVP